MLLILGILAVLGLVIRYVLNQFVDKDSNILSSANIAPGSIQSSYPSKAPTPLPKNEIPDELADRSAADIVEGEESTNEPKSRKKGFKLFENKADLRRSILIDDLLNRKF